MIRRNLIALFVGALLVPSVALGEVSQADQDACTPDVFKLCQEFIPNEAPIVSCLESKRSQLSPACARVMFPPSAAPQPTENQPKKATQKPRIKVPKKKPAKPVHHAKPKHKKQA